MVVYPKIAPWKIVWPEVDWSVLQEKRKAQEDTNLERVFNNYIMEKYNESCLSRFIQMVLRIQRQKQNNWGW